MVQAAFIGSGLTGNVGLLFRTGVDKHWHDPLRNSLPRLGRIPFGDRRPALLTSEIADRDRVGGRVNPTGSMAFTQELSRASSRRKAEVIAFTAPL